VTNFTKIQKYSGEILTSLKKVSLALQTDRSFCDNFRTGGMPTGLICAGETHESDGACYVSRINHTGYIFSCDNLSGNFRVIPVDLWSARLLMENGTCMAWPAHPMHVTKIRRFLPMFSSIMIESEKHNFC